MSEYDLHRKTNLPSQVASKSATKSFIPSAEIPISQLTDLPARCGRPRSQSGNVYVFCDCANESVRRGVSATNLFRFGILGIGRGLSTVISRTSPGQKKCFAASRQGGGRLICPVQKWFAEAASATSVARASVMPHAVC